MPTPFKLSLGQENRLAYLLSLIKTLRIALKDSCAHAL